MKTQQELMQAYWGPGGTVDMVKEYNAKHGCDVKPWECIKLWDNLIECHPSFDFPLDCYTFAITILYDDKRKEHRPVFVGDTVYDNSLPQEMEVIDIDTLKWCHLKFKNLDWNKISWNPPTPKRTFKIEVDEKQLELLITVTRPFCTGNHGSKLFMLLNDIRDKE